MKNRTYIEEVNKIYDAMIDDLLRKYKTDVEEEEEEEEED